MTNANYYDEGSYNCICDRCGQKYKRQDVRHEWTGLLTCFNCWDRKHPWNEPLPIAIDSLPVPDARPRPNAIAITSNPSDLSKWGGPYMMGTSLESDMTWDNPYFIWGGPETVPYNSTNFPLL